MNRSRIAKVAEAELTDARIVTTHDRCKLPPRAVALEVPVIVTDFEPEEP